MASIWIGDDLGSFWPQKGFIEAQLGQSWAQTLLIYQIGSNLIHAIPFGMHRIRMIWLIFGFGLG